MRVIDSSEESHTLRAGFEKVEGKNQAARGTGRRRRLRRALRSTTWTASGCKAARRALLYGKREFGGYRAQEGEPNRSVVGQECRAAGGRTRQG